MTDSLDLHVSVSLANLFVNQVARAKILVAMATTCKMVNFNLQGCLLSGYVCHYSDSVNASPNYTVRYYHDYKQ